MRIALFGYAGLGARSFKALKQLGEAVVAVSTHPDEPGETLWFESLAALAQAGGIPVFKVAAGKTVEAAPNRTWLEACRPEIILTAGFRALLPPDLLVLPSRGGFNLHPSLLPRYRGRAPLNWALIHGERETGMTLHHLSAAADAGDIVGQTRIDVGPDETAPELERRLEEAAAALLARFLPAIAAGRAPRLPQDQSQATYFGRRTPADGEFDWTWPARRIHDLVRALTRPYPGAFVREAGGRRLFLWKTRLLEAHALLGWRGPLLDPGEAAAAADLTHKAVGARDGTLEIIEWSRE